MGILPDGSEAARPDGMRALLDARSEAQAVHGLEIRTELGFGDVAEELTRRLVEAPDQLLILGVSDIDVLTQTIRDAAVAYRKRVIDRVAARRYPAALMTAPMPATREAGAGWRFTQPSVLPGFGLTFGFTTFFLSAIVLIPLAALVSMAASSHWGDFVHTVFSERAIASYRLSFGASLLAATINLVFGFILAWTLVRYDFPGRKLIDALIDLPFALPTAVSGIALTTVFAQNGWAGRYLELAGIKVAYTWIGVTIALTLIGMPFLVRTVQPAARRGAGATSRMRRRRSARRASMFRRSSCPRSCRPC